MTTRDTRKDEVYLEKKWEQVNHTLDNALSFEEALTSRPKEVNARAILYDIYLSYYKMFYCGYSIGLPLTELKEYALKIIEYIFKADSCKDYSALFQMMQFSIIFNIKSENIDKEIDQVNQNHFYDHFLQILFSYYKKENLVTTDKLLLPRYVKPFMEVIELAQTDKEAAVTRLKKYVDKQWFKTLQEGVITNRALEKKMLYMGFWCFEAAVLVKMLDLDDSILRDSEYYPWDIVHTN